MALRYRRRQTSLRPSLRPSFHPLELVEVEEELRLRLEVVEELHELEQALELVLHRRSRLLQRHRMLDVLAVVLELVLVQIRFCLLLHSSFLRALLLRLQLGWINLPLEVELQLLGMGQRRHLVMDRLRL